MTPTIGAAAVALLIEPETKGNPKMTNANLARLFSIIRALAELQDAELVNNRPTNAERIGDALDALYKVRRSEKRKR